MYIAPQARSWSRVRHSSSPEQQPLRSRQHPLGFPELHPEAREKTLHSNAESEVCCWFLEQAAETCESVVVFPEDLGVDAESGPSSSWDFLEVRAVDGEELHIIVSSPDRNIVGPWGCTQTCLRYRLRSSLRRTPTTLLPVPLRARSTQRRGLARGASSSGGCVWSLFWILKTLP